ncbi:membrane-anchored junction protein [Porphyrio hochstetteri]
MPLKPFTCPWPETRFLHAGRLVYKFKIRCSSFPSAPELHRTGSAAKELEEAIRVILGNLGELHPFSTEHFTVFPYWSKWERVSKMRFRHENVPLVPYPYVCTLYLEPKSLQQTLPCKGAKLHAEGADQPGLFCPAWLFPRQLSPPGIGVPEELHLGLFPCSISPASPALFLSEVNAGSDELVSRVALWCSLSRLPRPLEEPNLSVGDALVLLLGTVQIKCCHSQVCSGLKAKRKNEVLESTAEHKVVKRRVEVAAETSCSQPGVDGVSSDIVLRRG